MVDAVFERALPCGMTPTPNRMLFERTMLYFMTPQATVTVCKRAYDRGAERCVVITLAGSDITTE